MGRTREDYFVLQGQHGDDPPKFTGAWGLGELGQKSEAVFAGAAKKAGAVHSGETGAGAQDAQSVQGDGVAE